MRFTKTDLNRTLYVKPSVIEKERKWYFVDAAGMTLGRLAAEIAKKIQGKHKAHSCDFWDCGDFVVVTNVDKTKVTGYKLFNKMYHTYSGWKGNVKSKSLEEMMQQKPDKVLWLAVRGMLPKNKLRAKRMKRLKMFVGTEHNYKNMTLIPLLGE
jgi:large subunit ribosomal protein L13